jgi:hypothetical protein
MTIPEGQEAIRQDFSCAWEVMTKRTNILTRQSETRHQTRWTADPRVSAGRLQSPKTRKEKKKCQRL